MYGTVLGEGLPQQVLETASLTRDLFGIKLCSVLLYGSAALRGTRPDGDRDILMVTERDMTQGESLRMTRRLLELSGSVAGMGTAGKRAAVRILARGNQQGNGAGHLGAAWQGAVRDALFKRDAKGALLSDAKKTGEKRKCLSPVFAV